MKPDNLTETSRLIKVTWLILIIGLATAVSMSCYWRAPGLNLYFQDLLMRTRGPSPMPDEIVIIAIDETSIAKFGRFPWSRDLTAQVIDSISAAGPKAISLNVLYSEPTDEVTDEALVKAIKKSGKVVIGAQLIDEPDTSEAGRSVWLRSLPEIENGAAGIGHVNVAIEHDGAAREILLRLADDDGESRWALAIETVRVGLGLRADQVSDADEFVLLGTRRIPVNKTERNLLFELKDADSRIAELKPLRMTIDYIGPTGSFAGRTYSFADVLEGRVEPESFRGKYVLIGATAATLGDKIATPFVHAENGAGNQHGELMSGVEILANSINTILSERFYRPVSDAAAALWAAFVALAVLFLVRLAEGKFEAAKQVGGLAVLGALIIFGCYLVYSAFLIIPPVVPMIVSFAVAAPLALLRRSLVASAGIDRRIAELLAVEKGILTSPVKPSTLNREDYVNGINRSETRASIQKQSRFFPRGMEWKTQTLGHLSRGLIARSLFVDRALRSLEEGLLIAEPDGQITFANRRAAQILGLVEAKLIGSNLFVRLGEAESSTDFADQTIADLLIERANIKREITINHSAPRHYILRLSTVVLQDEPTAGEIIGIVATLTDVTKDHELQKTKNDVITLVTHELRTPLTAIQGMSEVLSEHEVEPEARRKMLSAINSEAKRLAQMINEYLDITRLESGGQKTRFGKERISDVLEQTLELLEPLAARREISLVRRFETDSPLIFSDAEMLVQALTNIVGNAIKYSPKNTKIVIETKTDDEMQMIIVTDEGYGIEAEQLPHIFEKFYRAPRERGIPGSGLGLALTRQIIELHGGRIEVESKLNVGSTFTVFLPFVAAPETD